MGKQHTVLMNLGTASVQKERGLEVREIANNHFGGTMTHALRYIIADWLKHNRRTGHMNVDTGEIGALQAFLDAGVEEDRLLPINIDDATQQQLLEMRVRKDDCESKLGKQRVSYVCMTKNQRKKFRQKLRGK